MERSSSMTAVASSSHDRRWYSAALKQVAEARWKKERLTIISGAPGAGKTTLCHQLADRNGTRTLVVLLTTPPATINELLRAIAAEIGVLSKNTGASTDISDDALRHAVRDFLTTLSSIGADCLTIVDDAHRLPENAIEELRALVGSGDAQVPLQIVLVGQFDAAIDQPEPLALPAPRVDISRSARPVPLSTAGYESTAVADEARASQRFARWRSIGLVATAAVLAVAMVWYGAAHRRQAVPPVDASQLHTVKPHADEAKLAAIVAEMADAGEPSAPRAKSPTSAVVLERADWADEVARRAAVLAKRPDVEGLLTLRSDVAALHVSSSTQSRLVESVLRHLDDSLKEARRRQLEIDHRQAATPSTSR
jgi:hypothetical protein